MNQAPQGQDSVIVATEDVPYTFSAGDFGFSDDQHQFQAVIITQVPQSGRLELGGVAVSDGQRIEVDRIGELVWTPPEEEFGEARASLQFQVVDDGGTAGGGTDTDPTPRTLTFDLTPVPDPPDAADRTFSTFEDVPFLFQPALFRIGDSDGDPILGIIIDNMTGAGELTLFGNAVSNGQLIAFADCDYLTWTPPPDVSGSAIMTFTVQAVDASGIAGFDRDPTPSTVTLGGLAVNDAPEGIDAARTVLPGDTHLFDVSDFGFTDKENNLLLSVIIAALPDKGLLTLDGIAVTAGQVIARDEIGGLLWTAPTGPASYGSTGFTFQIVDDGGTDDDGEDTDATPNTFTFRDLQANTPPSGADRIVTILEDGAHVFSLGDFGFSDPDSHLFTAIKIASLPANGSLRLNGTAVTAGQVIAAADIAALVWRPAADANGLGLAQLAFQVIDSGGGATDIDPTPNTITFNVTPMPEIYTGTMGHDSMSGTSDADTFYGLGGNDTINGGAGADTMLGSTGNDTYHVDAAGDAPVELARQGIDTIVSMLSWRLGANLENLQLAGAGPATGTGNGLANLMIGNGAANTLLGLGGNDTLRAGAGRDILNGGAGRDVLSGGKHADVFVFNAPATAAHRDTILDFSPRDDTIHLENAVFRKLGKPGVLKRDFFKLSTRDQDANDYILYNPRSGALYYDADGDGGRAPVHFATIANHAKLTFADFVVI
ncbi:MAG: hypothetical protein KF723_21310 [Rhizobiaceae bacterium]|nr:hypothetical protein [Rhizobiaceae bacterium]